MEWNVKRGRTRGEERGINRRGERVECILYIRMKALFSLEHTYAHVYVAPSLTCTTLCASLRSLSACSMRGAVSSFSGTTARMSSRSTILRSSSCKDTGPIQCYTGPPFTGCTYQHAYMNHLQRASVHPQLMLCTLHTRVPIYYHCTYVEALNVFNSHTCPVGLTVC